MYSASTNLERPLFLFSELCVAIAATNFPHIFSLAFMQIATIDPSLNEANTMAPCL